MSYCKPSDVRLLILTDLTDDELEDFIAVADEEIEAREITVNKKMVSMLIAASFVALRDPASQRVGEVSLTRTSPATYRAEAEMLIKRGEKPAFLAWTEPLR